MLDSVTPFKLARNKFYLINVYQFLSRRYGIGSFLTMHICNFSGIHYGIRMRTLVNFQFTTTFCVMYILKKIHDFFIIKSSSLDFSLKKLNNNFMDFLRKSKTIRSKKHINFLPVRGQRNRTNGKTKKKLKN
uniref:40S ribosomal protein S13 n=1 Tax=Pleurostomum flabellatum TaxID=405751 RepID=A0A7T0Q5M2_9EUKA|nr:40S ribosomal protein S13 [Pleurostomum flabellatum]QPL15624.1 40S ribosomal protein S13 [Pleurostomum flabellatum]